MHAHPLEARITHIEDIMVQVNRHLDNIERRLDGINGRFDGFGQRFDRINGHFNRLTAIVVGTWLTTILTILFHH